MESVRPTPGNELAARVSPRTARAALFAIAALLAIALVAAVYLMSRGPLAGDTSHDFGLVQVPFGGHVELKHTFHLTNRTDRAININAARPDCGCVVIAAPRAETAIEPGTTLDLPITMNFAVARKSVLIHLDLGDAGVQTLKVGAEAKYQSTLAMITRRVQIAPGASPAVLKFLANMFEEGTPAPPAISAPAQFRATFEGWRLNFQSKDLRSTPNQWEGTASVERIGESSGGEGALTIELKPAPPLRVPINSGPPQAAASPN